MRGDEIAHQRVVFHHHDGFVTMRQRRRSGWHCLDLAAGRRQIEFDRGAVADLTVDPDVSARLLDEAVDHAQAEA